MFAASKFNSKEKMVSDLGIAYNPTQRLSVTYMREACKNFDQLTQIIKMAMVELVGEDRIKIF